MNKKELTKEAAEALFAGIDDSFICGDIFTNFPTALYMSDETTDWRADTEKGKQFGDDEFDEVIAAWVPDAWKQKILSDEFHTCLWRYELHGFENGFNLALNILGQLSQMKEQSDTLLKSYYERRMKEWKKATA